MDNVSEFDDDTAVSNLMFSVESDAVLISGPGELVVEAKPPVEVAEAEDSAVLCEFRVFPVVRS